MTYRHAPEQQTHATASTPGTHNTPSCATSLTLKPSQPHALSFQTFNNSLRKDSFTGEGKIGLGGKSYGQGLGDGGFGSDEVQWDQPLHHHCSIELLTGGSRGKIDHTYSGGRYSQGDYWNRAIRC